MHGIIQKELEVGDDAVCATCMKEKIRVQDQAKAARLLLDQLGMAGKNRT